MVRILTAPRKRRKHAKNKDLLFLTALSVRVLEGRAMKRFHVVLGVADVSFSAGRNVNRTLRERMMADQQVAEI